MQKTVYKTFWAWNFDKEEIWLNEMAAQGWTLCKVSFFRYVFEETKAQQYQLRLELLGVSPNSAKGKEYISLLEESGAEYIGQLMGWAYFKKKTELGEFKLYSDNTSRLQHLDRLLALMGAVALPNLIIFLAKTPLFFQAETNLSLIFALINLAVSLLACTGFIIVMLKRRKLKKEQQLFD